MAFCEKDKVWWEAAPAAQFHRGSSSDQKDAAGLLGALGVDDVLVFGASSGGIPALQLALRHPELIRRALVYEPGYFRQVPGGEDVQLPVNQAVAKHLATHPDDWVGAWAAFRRAFARAPDAGPRGFFTPPHGQEWYAEREDRNAEAATPSTWRRSISRRASAGVGPSGIVMKSS